MNETNLFSDEIQGFLGKVEMILRWFKFTKSFDTKFYLFFEGNLHIALLAGSIWNQILLSFILKTLPVYEKWIEVEHPKFSLYEMVLMLQNWLKLVQLSS